MDPEVVVESVGIEDPMEDLKSIQSDDAGGDEGDGDEFDDDFGDFEEAEAAPVPSTSSTVPVGSVEDTATPGNDSRPEAVEPRPVPPLPTPLDSLFDTAVSACGSVDESPMEPEAPDPDSHQPAVANLLMVFDSREAGSESASGSPVRESLEVWHAIRCVEETPALRFHWLKSNAFSGLLFALGITPPSSSSTTITAHGKGSTDRSSEPR